MNTFRGREDQIVVVIPPTPWVTILLLLLTILGFYMSQSFGEQWLRDHAFSSEQFWQQVGPVGKIQYTLMPTFCQINILYTVINCYFLWVFGSTVELRIGNIFTGIIACAAIITGWSLTAQFMGQVSFPLFVGPAFLTCALLGGYLILMPVKRTITASHLPKYTYRIFARDKDSDPLEQFFISPWLIITAFLAYIIITHLYLVRTDSPFHILLPLPCVCDLALGFILTIVLVMLTTQSVEANPMKSLARKKYKELRHLDMTHEMATYGTALSLGVPKEKIEEWLGTARRL